VRLSNIEKFRFHGDELDVVRQGEDVFVSVRRVCEALGVDHASQWTKLKAKPWACIVLITTHDESGRNQEASCIHLDSLPMWLATIDTNRVAVGVRESVGAS
jgi:prophage antirepressor-like protein